MGQAVTRLLYAQLALDAAVHALWGSFTLRLWSL